MWPDVPLLGYQEFYYHLSGLDVGFDPEFRIGEEAFSGIRAKNAINLIALTNPGAGQTPTQFSSIHIRTGPAPTSTCCGRG